MKFNLSQILKKAWEFAHECCAKKGGAPRTHLSSCLKRAWALAKGVKEVAAAMPLQEAKSLLLLANYPSAMQRGTVGNDALHIIAEVAARGFGFASSVAATCAKYRKVSEKQAYVIARALVENSVCGIFGYNGTTYSF